MQQDDMDLTALFGDGAETPSVQDAIAAYRWAVQDLEMIEAEQKQASKRKSDAERALIAAMAEQCLESVKTEDGAALSINRLATVKVADGRQDDLLQWIREEGYGGVIKESVHFQTLGGIVRKDYLDAGKDVPDCLIVDELPKIRYSRAKGSKN